MKLKTFIVIIITFSLLLTVGCGLLPKEDERLDPPIKETREVSYKTQKVFRSDIEKSLSLFAQWKSEERISYSFTEYNAPLLEIKVNKGDKIKPGDVLAVLDIGDIDKKIRDMDISWQRQKLSYERVLERFNAGTASQFDLKIAALDLENVTNQYDDLKKHKEGSLLISDVEGTVLSVMNYEPGDEIMTKSTVVTIAKSDNIVLQATSSRIRTQPINPGHEVILTSNNITMNGALREIVGTTVTIEPEKMLDHWEIGSTVSVLVPIESAYDVLVVDRSAVSLLSDRNYVRVLEDGVAVEKFITIGISNGRYIEVMSGLEEGEEVILN